MSTSFSPSTTTSFLILNTTCSFPSPHHHIHIIPVNSTALQILPVVLLELLALALASSQTANYNGNLEQVAFKYYGNAKGSRIIEMYQNECHEFMDSDAAWIYKTRKNLVTILNSVQFELLLDKCRLHESPHMGLPDPGVNRNDTNDSINFVSMDNYDGVFGSNGTENGNSTGAAPIIYPGTKWCGRGDIARSYDDIGIYAGTDKCCRDHDNCQDNIPAGETRHGLHNQASFTSSHCECDDKFLRCLRNDHTLSRLTSSKIAHIYFNILKPLCFDERHPVTSCQQQRLTGECVRPEYDYMQGRQWQFFAAQPYFAKTVRGLLDTFSSVFGATEAPVADPTSHTGRRSTAMPPGFTF